VVVLEVIYDFLVCVGFVLESWPGKDFCLELKRQAGKKMNSYPIGDFLIRIKNGSAVDKKTVVVDWSKKLEEVAKILIEGNLVEKYTVSKEKIKKKMILELVYDSKGRPAVKQVNLFSKPGRRFYSGYKDLPYKNEPNGVIIISTSQGMMMVEKARKNNLGGEVIAEIY
jgi:small subunit ribosomal protein S8